MLNFTVAGRPIAWKRAQRNGRRTYKHPKNRDYQNRIRWCALLAMSELGHTRRSWKPYTGKVNVAVRIHPPDRRIGDEDRYLQQVGDALQGLVIVNDRQIHWLEPVLSVDRERPRLEVTVTAVAEGEGT